MSIIEQAVNALGKRKGKETQRKNVVEASVDSQVSEREAVDAVQRVEGARRSPPQTTAAEIQNERVNPYASEAPLQKTTGDVQIPFRELRNLGMLTPDNPRSAIAEEYRTIKRPLLINIAGDAVTTPIPHGNLIMVTSALEGDGKTFCAISLALSIAMEQDKTVLFVDADTSKADAGKMLGVAATSPGLIDLLQNTRANVADFILPTNVKKLRILPAGSLHTHANELLASARMQQLMLQLSEEDPDRVIIFDSPPLLLTTEATVLSDFMGQIVFVVSAELTPQHAVRQAIEQIGEEKMVGMVLNRSRKRMNPYYHAYGYGAESYESGLHDRRSTPPSEQ
jgi:exopolysaccharide/PEP-CTERM locus tyrosine autokinase